MYAVGEQTESHTDRQGNNLSQVYLGWSVIYSGQGHVIYRWMEYWIIVYSTSLTLNMGNEIILLMLGIKS